ncbi:MAG: 16S rRNA processing protein RimM [Myxococcales bacterium]|nr:16S rRNA processing protein RimM [Myxococcales bacterium]MCB9523361.1 16S rRNA processing protein RimM [Myxococcales bacterium]
MSDWLALGRLGRPHGVRGALRFWPFNAATEAVTKGGQARVGIAAEGAQTLKVAEARRDAKGWVVRFEGLSDRDEAGALNGALWFVERGALPAAGDDEFYFVDLFGKPAQTTDGRVIGTLVDVLDGPAGEILVIEGPDGRSLVPNVEAFVETLDPQAPAVVIRPIPGLLAGLDDE